MAGIFTCKALADVLNGESTPEEKVYAIYSLYGRAIDDGNVTKAAANAAKQDAMEQAKAEALQNAPKPNILDSEEYKALQANFDAYKTKQEARTSADYADVKPKFFDAVYDKIDRGENAKPIAEQMQAMRENFAEFFTPGDPGKEDPKPGKPQFGDDTGGGMPGGEKGNSSAAKKASVWRTRGVTANAFMARKETKKWLLYRLM